MVNLVTTREGRWAFDTDVIKHSQQLILIVRESVKSYTATLLLKDDRHSSLRYVLIQLCTQLHPLDGPSAIIQTVPAPGFKTLVDNKQQYKITLKLRRSNNPIKDQVAEKAG